MAGAVRAGSSRPSTRAASAPSRSTHKAGYSRGSQHGSQHGAHQSGLPAAAVALSGGPVSADDVLDLQRTAGNAATTQVLQRLVMTDKGWKQKSARRGRPRSADLLTIDMALAAYNRNQKAPPPQRLALLGQLESAIKTWQKAKKGKSRRWSAVEHLAKKVVTEKQGVRAVVDAATNPTTDDGAQTVFWEMHGRAAKMARTILTSADKKKAKAELATLANVRVNADGLATATRANPKIKQEVRDYGVGIATSIYGLWLIAEGHLSSKRSAAIATNLDPLQKKIRLHANQSTPSTKGLGDHLKKADDELTMLVSLASPKTGGGDIDWEPLEHYLDAAGDAETLIGFQGTDGKGNEGLNDLGKPADATGQQQSTREDFLKMAPTTQAGKDQVSGTADMNAAVLGLTGDAIVVYKAIQVLRDPDANKTDKAVARMTLLAKAPASIISKAMAFTGGAMTLHKGLGGKVADSAGFRKSTGADSSTDVKFAGDFFGFFSGLFDTVENVIKMVKRIKHPGAKAKGDSTRKQLERAGSTLNDGMGSLASLAGSFKTITKLGYQLKDGGQIAASSAKEASNVATLGGAAGAVPVIGLIKNIFGAIRQSYRLARIAIRRGDMHKVVKAAYARATDDVSTVGALEVAHESLGKRLVRLIIEVGHALVGITQSSLSMSGIGIGPGMILSIADSAFSLGQVALRKTKFAARDWKAKKREGKGKTISYKEWEMAKKHKAAGKGRGAQAKLAIKLMFIPNWDKATKPKASDVKLAALELLQLNDPKVFKALGVREELAAESNPAKKLDIVLGALKKRD